MKIYRREENSGDEMFKLIKTVPCLCYIHTTFVPFVKETEGNKDEKSAYGLHYANCSSSSFLFMLSKHCIQMKRDNRMQFHMSKVRSKNKEIKNLYINTS